MNQRLIPLEQVLKVQGEGFALNGILTIAPNPTTRVTVIIPNSGLVHRVGTCRSAVRFARRLAISGITCLRLDLSNLGDSPSRWDTSHLSEQQRTIQELQAAMDALQEHGQRFIIYGLCSGSQNGFKVAVDDQRVVGLMGVDHFGFRNNGYYWHLYRQKLLTWRPWWNLFKRLVLRQQTAPADEAVDLGNGEFEWQYPAKEQIESGYRVLVDRGVKLLYIYTGDWIGEYSYERQFFDMHSTVDFQGLADIRFQPKMSHILTEPSSQDYVETALLEFAHCFV